MFTFEPLTEEELKSINLIEPGIYRFEVENAEFNHSKAGNPMIKLTLRIFCNDGKVRMLTDHLVKTNAMMYKIKHFCDAVGLEEKYKQGSLSIEDCRNKRGNLEIIIKEAEPNPNGGMYSAKNQVKDYLKNPESIKSDFVDDDLPF